MTLRKLKIYWILSKWWNAQTCILSSQAENILCCVFWYFPSSVCIKSNATSPHSSTAPWRYPCCFEMTNSTGIWYRNVALYWRYQQTYQHCTSEEGSHKILNKNKHMVTPWEVKQEALKESTNHSNINSWLPLDSQNFLGQDTQWVCDLVVWADQTPVLADLPKRQMEAEQSCTVSSEEKVTGAKESSGWHTT